MPSSEPEGPLERFRRGFREYEQESGPPSFHPPDIMLGRYAVEASLGEGASATVYRATDRQLGRAVAIKVLRLSDEFGSQLRARFEREARAAAALTHPNLVVVHDVGEWGGRPYLVMELVEGAPLDRLLETRSLTRDRMLRVLEKAARGVAAAHERGIVHRDLKPSNILVGADGEPKVADFGLAQQMGSDARLTRTGSTVGTPLYMAPEQIRGGGGKATPRTDVYALGAILYEMLAGRPPFACKEEVTIFELYERILIREPVPPSRCMSDVPSDLESVCMKALEKVPELRYADAGEFADELARHLAGEPVRAARLSAPKKTYRWVRRRWRGIAGTAAVAALLLGSSAWILGRIVRDRARVRELVRRGDARAAQGRHQDARDAYRAALAVEEGCEEARAGLRQAETRLRETAAARKEAEELLDRGRPGLDEAFLYLYDAGLSYDELVRRVDRGQALIEEAVKKAPDLRMGHYLLGRAWELKGWHDRAEACWKKAIELDYDFVPARVSLARLLLVRADLAAMCGSLEEQQEALPEIQRLVREAGVHVDIAATRKRDADDEMLIELVAAMREVNNRDSAAVRARVASAVSRFAGRKGLEEFHWVEARVSEGREKLECLERALDLRPRYPMVLIERAVARLAVSDLDGALSDLDTAILVNPRIAEAYYDRALAHDARGASAAALADYSRALELKPTFSMAYNNRGVLRSRMQDLDGAIADCSEAIASNPRLASAYYNRGNARRERREWEAACADYDEALRIRSGFPEALYNRALARANLGRFDEATADVEKALAIAPSGWPTRGEAEGVLARLRMERR
ncbi:MAG: protein kinase [Planctomycetes bacterium]|nr:protein kinase [Planctomycetota bacterium]